MDPTVLPVSLLTCVAVGLVLWESFAPSTAKPLATYVALVALALALAFVLSSQTLPLFASVLGEARSPARLEYIMGGCFLWLMALALFCDGMYRSRGDLDVAVTHALPLMAACGGILALWSPNLMGLGVGVGLYTVAGWAAGEGKRGARGTVKAILGPLSFLLGAGLIYNETGAFDMVALGRFLWQHGEPQSFDLYIGLGLVLAGVALPTGFVPPFAFDEQGDGFRSHLLGVLVLLRLGLYLGALARAWFWLLLILSLGCLAWGWAVALIWRRDLLRRIGGLLIAQRGFLLLALSFIFRGQDVTLLVVASVAYALVQGVIHPSLRWLLTTGGVAPERLLSKAVLRAPMIGVPLCLGFLSLIGLPPTLGFIVRAELVRLAWAQGLMWLAPWVVAMSIICLWGLVPLVLPLLRGEGGTVDSPPPWSVRLSLVIAAIALVALGLFPLPLVRLADWLVGG